MLDLEKKTPRMGTPTHDRDMDSSVHSIRSTPELTPRMAAAIFSHQGNAGEPAVPGNGVMPCHASLPHAACAARQPHLPAPVWGMLRHRVLLFLQQVLSVGSCLMPC